jgi:hypothetical protein
VGKSLCTLGAIILVDVGCGAGMQFIAAPVWYYFAPLQVIFHILLMLWFFFLVWKTSAFIYGKPSLLYGRCNEFPIICVFGWYSLLMVLVWLMTLVSEIPFD